MLNNNFHIPQIIIISGATASGKSKVALEIAQKFNGAIINADALQIYRELPILSAQPSFAEQKIAPHFLYSTHAGSDKMSVAIWLSLVEKKVQKLLSQNQLPIIVGGTGMYISRLIDGINYIPEIQQSYRVEAQQLFDKIGLQKFQELYGNSKIIDKQKLLRRAEILMQTGHNIEYFLQQPPQKILADCQIIHLNLNPPREIIYQNCHKRFSEMLKIGALEEVKNALRNPDFSEEFSYTKTLGFNEISKYLSQQISREQMIEIATQKTRNYAKRQLTWFRHQFKDINFFENQQNLQNFVTNFL